MDFFTALHTSIWKGQFWMERINAWIEANGADVVLALIEFAIGYYLLKLIRSFMVGVLERAQYDKTVGNFILKSVHYLLMIGLILFCLNQVGFPTGSILAAFGAFGIAVGLALQNNMSNFASGLLILFFKPLKVGDWVRVDSLEGSVVKIDFMSTQLATKDKRMVFIPNSDITAKAVINYSHAETRFIEFIFDISYESDYRVALDVLKRVFALNPRVIKRPGVDIEMGIYNFSDNSVQLRALPEVDWGDYTAARYEIMAAVKDAFDEKGITIPYPQRVVHVEQPIPIYQNELATTTGRDDQKDT